MAYMVSQPVVTKQASGGTVTPSFGNLSFVADDYILIKVTNRQTTGTNIPAPAGYTRPVANGRNGNVSECWLYKKAAGGDAAPTITVESAQVIVKVYQVRDADATTFLSATPTVQNWTTVSSFNHNTYSAGAGDLVIFSASSGTGLLQPRMKAADCTALNYTAQTSNCDATEAYRQYTSAATTPALTTYMNASGSGQATVLVIKNKTNGLPQVDLRTALSELNWYGSHGATHQAVTWEAPSAFTLKAATALVNAKQYEIVTAGTTDFTLIGAAANTVGTIFTATGAGTGTGTAAELINGIRVSTTAPTTGTNTTVPTTIGIFTLLRSTENPTTTTWVGGSHAITSADLTGFLLSLQWYMSTSSTVSRHSTEGVLVGVSDGTNWAVYRIASQEKGWLQTTLDSIVVALGNATVYASSGTVDLTAITRCLYGWHRATGSATADDLNIRNALLIPTTLATTPSYSASLTGGGEAFPATAVDFYRAVTSWDYLGLATLQGANQVLARIDACFGDGTNPTYVDDSAYPISYPGAYSTTRVADWQMNWNVPTQAVAIAIKTKSTDTINLIATAIVASNRQKFVIDAASDTGATVSVAGAAIVGKTFTDYAGFVLGTGTFKSGGTVTLKASQTGLNVSKTEGTVPAVSMNANSKTLTSCTIDVTGTSATYHLSLAASITAITLNTVTLTGTPATDKIYSALASGTLTITTDGLGTALVAGDVTFIGGSTAVAVIAAPQPTLSATVLAGTRVVLWNRTTSAELDNVWVAGTSWSKIITSGAATNDILDLYTFREGYLEARATISYAGANAAFAVDQATDPAIQYYRTAESITDYTTLAEFNFYAPDIYIQSDDADGVTSLKRLFIFYNGSLTTEDGARYMRGGITFNSAFDVVINRSVRAIAVDNVSVTLGLYFTDEATIRVTTDDGTSWIAPPSAPGSIRYAFGVSPGQIETGVSGLTGPESAQLMALPSATAIAQQVVNGITFP